MRNKSRKQDRNNGLLGWRVSQVLIQNPAWKPGAPSSEAWLPNAADLRHLAVDPALQGRGLAKPLLDEAERIAREEWKVEAVCLHVRRGNHGVARLYMSRGYVRMM